MVSKGSIGLAEIQEALSVGDVAGAFTLVRSFVMEPVSSLDFEKMDRLIDKYRDQWLEVLQGRGLRLAILGGYTTRPIKLAVRLFLLCEGIMADVYEAEYNTFKIEVLDPTSKLYSFQPQIVIIATGSVNIESFPESGATLNEVDTLVRDFVEEYQRLWSMVQDRTGALVLMHNFEPMEENVLGSLEHRYPWSKSRFVGRINERLWDLDGQGMRIVNVHGLSNKVGSYNWYDPRWYFHGKYGFHPNFTYEYGNVLAGLFRAINGKSKKCLVTDLDNTLWGGVIGDDGLAGIRLGNISAEGEAYRSFCHYLKKLKQRGVILAVNSKNDPALVSEVFSKHPEMPLQLDDFAAFFSNWESKSSNLRSIAQQLNIGMDSLVFIDDNPVECAEIRSLEPSVAVVEMGGDPAYFIRKLEKLCLFDQLNITDEDLKRPFSYATEHKINEFRQSSGNLEDFLSGLEMKGRVALSSYDDLPRLEQIIKKTNQFNLTSRQYDRSALLSIMNEKDGLCLSCWLKDRFNDYGLVSQIVGHFASGELLIENWVMSCRVFSRTFEQFIFNKVKDLAKEHHCSRIKGQFVPTPKNNYVKNLYERLGFFMASQKEEEWWIFHLNEVSTLESFVCEE